LTTFKLPDQKSIDTERIDAFCRELTDLTGLVFVVWSPDSQFWMPVGFSTTLTGLLAGVEPAREPLRRSAVSVFEHGEVAVESLRAGLSCLAIPIRQRHRTVHVLTAAVLTTAADIGDVATQLAETCGVSQAEGMQRLSGETPFDPATFTTLMRLLSRLADEYILRLDMEEEVSDVSRKLSEGYEEITLYQRMASKIRVSQPTDAFFLATCSELLEFLDVETLAAIHCEKDNRAEPKVVTLGDLPLGSDQLLKLYRHFERDLTDGREAVIANECESSSEISDYVPGVRNMILVPLRQGKKLYGVIAAFNKRNDVEFYSTDVKLVSSVSGVIAIFVENTHLYGDLQHLMLGTVKALVSSIDAKDPYTCGHSERVAMISKCIAERMGLPKEDVDRIYLSGLLHDIGKIGVPERILLKDGRLNDDEFNAVKMHPEIGARILTGVRELANVIPGVMHHHERLDGGGYPAGLNNETMPLDSRIIGLADALDAMTSNRVYRAALPIEEATKEILLCTGTQFDVRCVDALMEIGVAAALNQLPKQSRDLALETSLGRA
jgi:HD-GYP domain-containing protein (c-di-GMP phosphodiesterase class II)